MSEMTGCEFCGVGPEDECLMDCPSRQPGFQRDLEERSEVPSIVVPDDWWAEVTMGETVRQTDAILRDILIPTAGVVMIAAERQRQVTHEGYDPAHDDEHIDGELRFAAIRYAQRAFAGSHPIGNPVPEHWPWAEADWKPSNDPVVNLTKAGALLAAEIDRLLRARSKAEDEAEINGAGL